MNIEGLINLLPFLILSAGIIVTTIVIAIRRNHKSIVLLSLITLVLSFASLFLSANTKPIYVTTLLVMDGFAIFYIGLLVCACIVTAALSFGYLENRRTIKEEYYVLLLIALLGCMVIVSSSHFASFFLGLELLSVSLYILIAYFRWDPKHIEAGIKYLVPASVSTAFLLFGIALIYLAFGTLEFSAIKNHAGVDKNLNTILLTGFALIAVGIGFKLALVPFHFWAPDVYQGAPAPITGFISTASKGSVLALLLRYFNPASITEFKPLFIIFFIFAAASMFFGNLLALLQNNIKRLLAYSSIAQVGYMLTAFLAGGNLGIIALSYYLVAYFATMLAALGVITILSNKENDLENLEDYRGLFSRHPWLTLILTFVMLSLAGIPLTAGFIGKFYVLSAGVNSSLWILLIILVINSAIGLYYYLRVIGQLYKSPEVILKIEPAPSFSAIAGIALFILTIGIVWFGIYPSSAIKIIELLAIDFRI